MSYTVKELDVAKCEFVKKMKAADGECFHEYNGQDEWFAYYRDITGLVNGRHVSVTLLISESGLRITWWDDEKGVFSELTLEEFRAINFTAV